MKKYIVFIAFVITNVNVLAGYSVNESTPIRITGNNIQKGILKNGEKFFSNRDYRLRGIPKSFENFEFLLGQGNKDIDAEIIVEKTGIIYIIATPGAKPNGWTIVKGTDFYYDDKAQTRLCIYEKNVKAGDRIKLPSVNNFPRVRALAESIIINTQNTVRYQPNKPVLKNVTLLGLSADTMDLRPLKSANSKLEGPLNLPYFRDAIVGSAFVFDSQQPDIFILGKGLQSGVYLYKWLRTNDNGAPVFASPIKIKMPFIHKGTIFQTKDNQIHGFWIEADSLLVHTIFDKKDFSFKRKGHIRFPRLPSVPQNIAAFPNEDGSIDIAVEIRGYRIQQKYKDQKSWDEDWRPYDDAGISSQPFQFNYLCSFRLSKLSDGRPELIQQASMTNKEAYFSMLSLSPVNFGDGAKDNLITGSRLGEFLYYTRLDKDGLAFDKRKYIVDENENIIRHPSINPSVYAYPESKGGITHLIAGGEGPVYYYHFTGKFTKNGDPIFKNPVLVQQEDANIFMGTLPTMSVSDWDGDGIQDLIVGSSEGFLLFSKNIGTNENPEFLPGKRIQSGDRDIYIQAGYSGSVQGTPESRWGYLCPTLFDWNEDGLPDVIMGDITGNYTIYINKGTKTQPKLDIGLPIYCEGMELHGMWRCRPAIGKFGNKIAMIIVDGEDEFHLFWKRDDYNVEDGGKVLLSDRTKIGCSAQRGAGTGRAQLSFFDYDGDGKLDLIIGTGHRNAIPNKSTGFPLPILGESTMGTPLFMRNVGTGKHLVFEHPVPFFHPGIGLVQPGGKHETGAIGTSLGGGNKKNLMVADETGRIFLLQGNHLELMTIEESKKYRDAPNPFPGFPYKRP